MAQGGRNCAVAIVSHRRPDRLRALLASLRPRLGTHVTQVVVVEDGDDPTPIEDLTGEVPTVHRLLPGRTFISRAKNLALAEIASPYVAFIDDDNVVPPGALERLLGSLEGNPRCAAVMPSVLYKGRPELVWVYSTPFREGRWAFDLIGRNAPRDSAWEGRLLPTDALPNACLLRTTPLRSVGGWDEALPINSSADLCRRLKGAGWDVRADSGAFFLHDVEDPSQRGYWAAHADDPERLYFEMHDWYLYQRRLHSREPLFTLRALRHALPFTLGTLGGLCLRPETRRRELLLAVGRGTLAGLRAAARSRAGASS